MNLYIKPHLGEKQLSKITSADVRELYATLKRKGRVRKHPKHGHRLSDSMVHSIHTVLYGAMKAAQKEQLIVSNPAAEVPAPKTDRKAMQVLNEAQLDIFMEVVQADELWRDFFYTELTTGLRRGEICGLRWDDFDVDAGTLNISRTLHVEKGGRLTTGDTKTYAGTRTIILPPSTAEILRARRRSALSVWIFPDLLKPGEPTDPNAAYRQMKKLLAQAGLPSIRFHDLRHTFSTHALANGVDAKTLAGILGHTKASFTLDTYTHITGDMQQRAAEIVLVVSFTTAYNKEKAPSRKRTSSICAHAVA